MSAQDLNLNGVRSLTQALDRTENGTAAAALADRLGLWTRTLHQSPETRAAFKSKFSDLGPNELSDLNATWIAEAGRVVELVGLLSGLQDQLKVRAKSARASARAKARRDLAAAADGDTKRKAPTVAELNDMAEEDSAVKDIDDQLAFVALLLASAQAAKEATYMYRDAISREITFRCEQMKARLY